MAPLLFDQQYEEEEIIFDIDSAVSHESEEGEDDDEDSFAIDAVDLDENDINSCSKDIPCSQEYRILVASDAAAMGKLTRLAEHIVESTSIEKKSDFDGCWSGIKAANQLDIRSIHIRVCMEAAALGRVYRGSERPYTVANWDQSSDDIDHGPVGAEGCNETDESMITIALATLEEAEYQVDDILQEIDALGEVDPDSIDNTLQILVKLKEEIDSLSHHLLYKPNRVTSRIDDVIRKQRDDISKSWAHHLTVLEDLESYQLTKDTFHGQNLAVLPCLEEPAFVKPVHYMTKKNKRQALAIQAAKGGMLRMELFSSTDTIRIRRTCSCSYCGNPTVFQTQSYKKMRLRKKANDDSLKNELVGLARKRPAKRITLRRGNSEVLESRAKPEMVSRRWTASDCASPTMEDNKENNTGRWVSPRTKRRLEKEEHKQDRNEETVSVERFGEWISPSRTKSTGTLARASVGSRLQMDNSIPAPPPLFGKHSLHPPKKRKDSRKSAPAAPKVKTRKRLTVKKEKSDRKLRETKSSRKLEKSQKSVRDLSKQWESRKPDPPAIIEGNELTLKKEKSHRKISVQWEQKKCSKKETNKSDPPTPKDEKSRKRLSIKKETACRKVGKSRNAMSEVSMRWDRKKRNKKVVGKPDPPTPFEEGKSKRLSSTKEKSSGKVGTTRESSPEISMQWRRKKKSKGQARKPETKRPSSKKSKAPSEQPIQWERKKRGKETSKKRRSMKKAKSDRMMGKSKLGNKRGGFKKSSSERKLHDATLESESSKVWVSPRSQKAILLKTPEPSPYALQKARLSKVSIRRSNVGQLSLSSEEPSNEGWASPRSEKRMETTISVPSPYSLQQARLSEVITKKEDEDRSILRKAQSQPEIGSGPSLRSIMMASASYHKANSGTKKPPSDVDTNGDDELQAKMRRERKLQRRALVASSLAQAVAALDADQFKSPASKKQMKKGECHFPDKASTLAEWVSPRLHFVCSEGETAPLSCSSTASLTADEASIQSRTSPLDESVEYVV